MTIFSLQMKFGDSNHLNSDSHLQVETGCIWKAIISLCLLSETNSCDVASMKGLCKLIGDFNKIF